MRRYLGFGVALALALSALAGCARWINPSGLPVPPVVTAPQIDLQEVIASLCVQKVPTGTQEDQWQCSDPRLVTLRSLRQEPGYRADHVITEQAWRAIEKYIDSLRQGWCEGRAALQIANGGDAEKLPLCEPVGP